jgi:Protease inhibitor Inh
MSHLAILAAVTFAGVSLASCSLDRIGTVGDDTAPSGASARGAASASTTLTPVAMPRGGPPVEMTGRWVLASTGTSSCGMVFNSAVGALEGTVAPEGGCPGKLFMSRKWTFEQNSLVLRNHNGEPLAQLGSAEPGKLEGHSTNGEPVTLTR